MTMTATGQGSVLVVDDESDVRSALGRTLRGVSCEMVEAGTGDDALALLATRRFDCALVDLRMPGMGGMELVRRARAVDPGLPVIVVTGHGDIADARQSASLGVTEFVIKPWDVAELQALVARSVQARRIAVPDAAPLEPGVTPGADASPSSAPSSPDAGPPRPGTSARPARLELIRLGGCVVDSLRSGILPTRFAPVPGVSLDEAWEAAPGAPGVAARLARADPELAARMSWLARVELRADTALDRALETLGPRRTFAVAATAVVCRMFDVDDAVARTGGVRALRHAVARAVAMRTAAELLPALRVNPRRAHLTGLFSDVGAACVTGELAAYGAARGDAARFAAEQHSHVSGWIAAAWRLPGECVVACAQHHASNPLGRGDPLTLLLWACEPTVRKISGGADPDALPSSGNAARLAGVDGAVRTEVESACRDALERLAALTEPAFLRGAVSAQRG